MVGVTIEEFQDIIKQAVRDELNKIAVTENEKYISATEVIEMFVPKISRTTLWHWVKKGVIKSYTVGDRTVYKRSDIIESVKEIKRYETTKGLR